MGGNLTNLEEQQVIKTEFVLKTCQDKKVLTIEMMMKNSQKNMERSVEGKGKSFENLLAQELVGKTNISTKNFSKDVIVTRKDDNSRHQMEDTHMDDFQTLQESLQLSTPQIDIGL
jgi:hypothetical protein